MTAAPATGRRPTGHLAALLRAGKFVVTSEVVPPRSGDAAGLAEAARALVGSCDAVNVTDNPGAAAHMSPVAGAAVVAAAGVEPTVQLTCRDRNRLALTGDLLGAWALGARNVLCLSGDPLAVGDHPGARTADDVTVLDLVRLARRLRDEGRPLSGEPVAAPPRYLVGVADTPLVSHYDFGRLEAKLDAGADFLQTQIVFDVDAFGGWVERARERGVLERVAVLPGVAVARSARALRHLREHLPGVAVPDEVVARLEAAGPRGEEEAGVLVTTEVVRAIRAMPGIAGVHVMGLGRAEPVRRVVAAAGLFPRAA